MQRILLPRRGKRIAVFVFPLRGRSANGAEGASASVPNKFPPATTRLFPPDSGKPIRSFTPNRRMFP